MHKNLTAIEVIIKYILYGQAKAIEAAGEDDISLKVIEHIRKLREYKTCNDENKIAHFIPELDIKHVNQIPSTLMKSQMVIEIVKFLRFYTKLFIFCCAGMAGAHSTPIVE